MNASLSSSASFSDRLMTEIDAALFLGLSVRTLQQWRVAGGGPKFTKLGRAVRYAPSDLSAFVEAGRRAHTSEGTR